MDADQDGELVLKRIPQLCGKRGQLFLEVGFGLGEVARLLASPDGFGAAWLGPDAARAPQLQRRVVGWVGSRLVRGLVLVWPGNGEHEVFSPLLLAAANAALRCGCPTLLVVPVATWRGMPASARECLQEASDGRELVTHPCQHQAGQAHGGLRVLALRAGVPRWTGRRCSHPSARSPCAASEHVRFGRGLSELLASWLQDSCDRLHAAHTEALAGL